jgi:uncharacterized protein (DUF1800 family)
MAGDRANGAIRFGAGLGPAAWMADPEAGDLLAELAGPDVLADTFPAVRTAAAMDMVARYAPAKRSDRDKATATAQKDLKDEINAALVESYRAMAARWMDAEIGFRERLVLFWTVRPHVAGRFADMLKAAVTHPMMMLYLTQVGSIGPNSATAQKRKRGGLNENLAREVLELHTLGVGGAYTQDDVRQFAELLTGLTLSDGAVPEFRPANAEPGAETVLGVSYGGDPAKLGDIHAALDALSVHPDTARHIARKLAVHFVSDAPDAGLVRAMADAFAATGGDLTAVCAAMLEHPAAWAGPGAKVRWPVDFVLAGARALGLDGRTLVTMPRRRFRALLTDQLDVMGQPWLQAPGPDGWPEEAEAWVTPQGMAARIDWAMRSPAGLVAAAGGAMPDPRGFVQTALGGQADEALVWAAERAETREEGVGLILASPAFNRR